MAGGYLTLWDFVSFWDIFYTNVCVVISFALVVLLRDFVLQGTRLAVCVYYFVFYVIPNWYIY